MVFDPLIGGALFDQIERHAKDQLERKLVEKKGVYWLRCPSCGRLVVRRELIQKGCYVCGRQGTEEEIRLAKTQVPSRVSETTALDEIKSMGSYKVDCPQCGTRVVREELIEKGCYLCGWRPEE